MKRHWNFGQRSGEAILDAIGKTDVGDDVIIHNEDGSIWCILRKVCEEHEESHMTDQTREKIIEIVSNSVIELGEPLSMHNVHLADAIISALPSLGYIKQDSKELHDYIVDRIGFIIYKELSGDADEAALEFWTAKHCQSNYKTQASNIVIKIHQFLMERMR